MITQPTTHGLGLRSTQSQQRHPRPARTRRIARAIWRFASEWHHAAEKEWILRAERPFSRSL
jgi:hypothetical protein